MAEQARLQHRYKGSIKAAMKRRNLLWLLPLLTAMTSCAHAARPRSDRDLKGMGMVVKYELAPGASNKQGLSAISDAGNSLYGASTLNPKNNGTSSIGGGTKMSFPRWVQVTRRENTTSGEYWTTGTVVGDYRVEALGRIPDELFTYVDSHPQSVIVLRFRIKDDGVLFGWAAQETGGAGFNYLLQGGEF